MEEVDVRKMAEVHVDWLLSVMREPMIQEFIHGYSHGHQDGREGKEVKVPENYGDNSRIKYGNKEKKREAALNTYP